MSPPSVIFSFNEALVNDYLPIAGSMDALTDKLNTWIEQIRDLISHTAKKGPEGFQHTYRDPSTCNHRKRGTDKVPSLTSEESPFVNTQHDSEIIYDGETQKLLHEIWYNIGIAMNDVRRISQIRTNRPLLMNTALEGSDDLLLSQTRSARNRGPPPQAQPMLKAVDYSKQLQMLLDKFEALAEQEKKRSVEEKEAAKKEDTPQVELVPLMVSPTSNKPTSDPGAIEVDDKTDSEETSGLVYLPSPTKGCENMG